MGVCDFCHQDMKTVNSCKIMPVIYQGKTYQRDRTNFGRIGPRERCHDCKIICDGKNEHHPGCDVERCTICGGQAVSCRCEGTVNS